MPTGIPRDAVVAQLPDVNTNTPASAENMNAWFQAIVDDLATLNNRINLRRTFSSSLGRSVVIPNGGFARLSFIPFSHKVGHDLYIREVCQTFPNINATGLGMRLYYERETASNGLVDEEIIFLSVLDQVSNVQILRSSNEPDHPPEYITAQQVRLYNFSGATVTVPADAYWSFTFEWVPQ